MCEGGGSIKGEILLLGQVTEVPSSAIQFINFHRLARECPALCSVGTAGQWTAWQQIGTAVWAIQIGAQQALRCSTPNSLRGAVVSSVLKLTMVG